jgi:ribosomal protein S18 acetylase RimI-like enzyme
MATFAELIQPAVSAGHMRAFDVRHDLRRVADLVEQCFADTLDPDGERYLRQMRSAADNPSFLRWATTAGEWASVPLTGYVWEENGRLVGNVNLIPFYLRGRRYYMIANVAVHPDFRGRGIARILTAQAIEHMRLRGAPEAWLHVREENAAAIHLYDNLGFVEQARRTTWFTQPNALLPQPPEEAQVLPRRSQDWPAQKGWLKDAYPPVITWHLPLNFSALDAGWLGRLRRLVGGVSYKQWSVLLDGRLGGVLTWQAARSFADTLWLAADPELEAQAASALLTEARRLLGARRSLSLDYPAHRADQGIQAAGFYAHQTLIWMSLPLSTRRLGVAHGK